MGFRDHLSKNTSTDSASTESNRLSPLAERLSDALSHVGASDPRLSMVVGALAKHLRKNPVADEDILAALNWIEQMAHHVRHGPSDSDPQESETDGTHSCGAPGNTESDEMDTYTPYCTYDAYHHGQHSWEHTAEDVIRDVVKDAPEVVKIATEITPVVEAL